MAAKKKTRRVPARRSSSKADSSLPWGRLLKVAHDAASQAYAPYSQFQVGAAILDETGRIFGGCNVENASYGLTSCAERNAIFAAVGAGARRLECVVVYTPTPTPTTPCGACRQVIREFGPKARILSVCDGDGMISTTLEELLPSSFGPENLG